MNSFLFLLALGLASSDKLDRSYLPPPGSKFSGGSPGSLQVPLEFPKRTYSTTLRPLTPGQKDNGLISPEDSQPTIGINRGTGLQNGVQGTLRDGVPVTAGPNTPFTYFQNSYKVPTTTTSYAFTQTTTFPPSEGFETTINPVGPTGPPTVGSFNNNVQQQTGYSQNQGTISPEYAQPGFVPGINVNGQQPGFGYQSQIPVGQALFDGLPGIIHQPQDLNQFQQHLHPSSTVSPIHGTSIQSPGYFQSPFDHNQGLIQHLGVQPPKQLSQPGILSTATPQANLNYVSDLPQFGGLIPTQFIGQQDSISSTATPQNVPLNQPTSVQYGGYPNVQEINASGSNIPQTQGIQLPTQFTGHQNAFPPIVGTQRFPSNQPGSNQYDYPNIQGTIASGTNIPEQLGGKPGLNQYGGDLNSIQGTLAPGSTIQSRPFQQGQPVINNQFQNPYQINNERVSQLPSSTSGLNNSQNIYRPDSTATPSVIPPGYYNQSSYPSTTPTIPTYGTTLENIPSSAIPSTFDQGLVPIRYPQRPERPQAESDRNAVILDYKNIITPEGFEYSFDTSNGIHADENGTAIDGVKAQGSYSYTGDDGKVYRVVYSADENGFRPQGDHLPTPPPIPKAIQRVIDQAVKDKEAGITHDGSYDDNKYGHKKYQGFMNRYRPQTQDRIITNGADIPDDYETTFTEDGNRKIGSSSTRRPITGSEDTLDEYDDMQFINADRGRGITKKPGHETEINQYKYTGDSRNQIKENQKPTEYRIDSINRFEPDNNDSPRFRLTKPGRKQTIQSSRHRLTGSQDDEEESPEKTQDYDNQPDLVNDRNRASSLNGKPFKPGNKYINNSGNPMYLPEKSFITVRPTGTKRPSNANTIYKEELDGSTQEFDNNNDDYPSNKPFESGTQLIDSDEYSEDYKKSGLPTSGRPKATKRPGFSSITRYNESGIPRRPGVSIFQDNNLEDNSSGFHNRRPTSSQNGQLSNDQLTSSIPVQAEEGSGYQYIPPQNKFTQGKINRFPARFPDIESISSTKRPSTIPGSTGTMTTTIQPFITPNVYRQDDNDESYEDTRDQIPSRKPTKPTGIKSISAPSTQTDYEDYDKELKPDQEIGDEIITTSKVKPGKPSTIGVNSTRRPLYEQKTSASPNDQYTTADQEKDNQEDVSQPEQRIEMKYPGDGNQVYRRPGQKMGSSRKPIHASISTPSMPPYTKQTTQSQYPTTYDSDTTVTSSDSDRSTAPGFRRPGTSRVPGRPTSRPDSVYTDRTTVSSSTTLRPETSKFSGRLTYTPIADYSDSDKSRLTGSTTRRPGVSSVTSRPTTTYFDRNTLPESINIRPGSSRPFGRPEYSEKNVTPSSVPGTSSVILPITETIQAENLPSTTYRPNYTFADVTTRPTQPDQPGQPGQAETFGRDQIAYTVDQFGRRQPAQFNQQSQHEQIIDQFGRPQSIQQGQLGQPDPPGQPGQALSQQGQAVDQFGRPQSGQLEQPIQPGQSGQKGQTVNQFGRPQSGQSGQPSQQGQIVDQFRRPQLGQPEHSGYSEQIGQMGHSADQFRKSQPGRIEQPGQVGQPGQTVDQFGRPQSGQFNQYGRLQPGQQGQPGQPGQPDTSDQKIDQYGRLIPTSQPVQEMGSTYRPNYSKIPAQGSSTNYSDGIQAIGTPGSVVKFKPSEPRFGSQTPNENGPTPGQTQSYLGSNGPTSTERVIGEDFSGPKQPQRYDPETGYHY